MQSGQNIDFYIWYRKELNAIRVRHAKEVANKGGIDKMSSQRILEMYNEINDFSAKFLNHSKQFYLQNKKAIGRRHDNS